MVHLPLLPRDAVVIEMFNCGHFSYLYASLALNLGVRYFTMQRTEPWCYKPQSLYGDTRKNMSKTYAFTQAEAEPVLMQAVRYHMWQDPTPDVSGREPKCEAALKILRSTGALPIGMTPKRWTVECLSGLRSELGAAAASVAAAEAAKHRAWRERPRLPTDGDAGDGSPGQYTVRRAEPLRAPRPALRAPRPLLDNPRFGALDSR